MNGYQALANGIIEQAVKDYREALRRLKKHPDDKAAMKEAMELFDRQIEEGDGEMTAKEYLNQAYWLDRRIDSKLEQLSALKDMATKTTSIMSDDVVSHTRNVHSMQDVIAKIIDMQAEINADIDRLVDLKRDIMQVVKTVDDPELQTLLELRYLCFKDWQDIAYSMHCTESNVFKVHSKALQAVKLPKLGSEFQ